MWLPLILLTAFFISLQDIFGKKIIDRVDPYVVAWGWVFFSIPLFGAGLLIDGIPPLGPPFWMALAISTGLLTFALVFYFKAFKYSDLSIAVPMLAFTPLFLLFTSPLILGEFPGFWGIIGVLLIVIGSYVLHLKESRKNLWEPFRRLIREKGVRYMLMVAVLFSISGNLDKVGVVHSSAFMWLLMLNFALTVTLSVLMFRNVPDFGRQIKGAWPYLVAVGTCSAIALIFQMTAIRMTLVPYLIAVKRTSVIMTSLFGLIVLKEKGFRERLIGVALMVAGVFLISFSS